MSLAGAAAGGAGGDDQHPRRILWKKPAGPGPAKQVRKKAIGKGGPENSSCPYKGARQRTWGKWVSEIRDPNHRSKRLWLGSFDTAREAAIAYDNAAWRLYGETDRLNFPELIQPPAPSAEPREVSGGGATSEAVVAEEEEIWSGLGDLPDMEKYKYPW